MDNLNLELLNKWFFWINIQLILLLLIYILLHLFNSLHILFFTLFWIPFFTNTWLLPMYNVHRGSKTVLLHITLLIAFISSLHLSSSVFISWDYHNLMDVCYTNYRLRSSYSTSIKVDSLYVIDSVYILNNNSLSNLNNSFFWLNNNPGIQYFILDTVSTTLKQTILNHSYLYTFKVSIQDIPPYLIDLLFTSIILSSYTLFIQKIKIIS